MYMDVVQCSGDAKAYWQKGLWGDTFVQKVMSRDRFSAICCSITWRDTTDVPAEERQSSATELTTFGRSLLSFLCWKKYYTPNRQISINEVCIVSKGHNRCRCYNPIKSNEWYFKIFALYNSLTGYMWNWELYRGKDEQQPAVFSASEWPIRKLTEPAIIHRRNYML